MRSWVSSLFPGGTVTSISFRACDFCVFQHMTLENPHFQQKIHLHGGLSSQSRKFLVQLDGDPKTLVCLVGDLIISTMGRSTSNHHLGWDVLTSYNQLKQIPRQYLSQPDFSTAPFFAKAQDPLSFQDMIVVFFGLFGLICFAMCCPI